MKAFNSLAVILVLTVSSFGAVFTSAVGRFSADFVEVPTTDTRVSKTVTGDKVNITSFFAENKSMAEILDYTDLPTIPTQEQLIATARGAFAGRKLDGLGINGVREGRTWILAAGHDEQLIYLYAITSVDKRIYEITIAIVPTDVNANAKANEVAAETFLNSVKITD